MKKLLAITLLVIHLFNVAGYHLLFRYFIDRSETSLTKKLDVNKYEEQDLVVLKTPLQLPYYNASNGYERIDGEIEMEGVHYSYVKRRISNDTLYLYCIPNTAKTKLSQAQNEYSKQAGDSATDQKKDGTTPLKKMKWGTEYNEVLLHDVSRSLATASTQENIFLLQAEPFPFMASAYKPPEPA